MSEADESGAAANGGGPAGPARDEEIDWQAVQAEFDRQAPAWVEYRALQADYLARAKAHARMIADDLSVLLPEGMRFGLEMSPLGDEQLDQFAAEWKRQMARNHGVTRLLTPLPRRVRLRLAVARTVDRTAIWLVDRKRFRSAERLWRASKFLLSDR